MLDLEELRRQKLAGVTFSGSDSDKAKHLAEFDQKLLREFKYYRYLSFHNLPPSFRTDARRLSSFLVNSLSREEELVVPAAVGPEQTLVRVNLFDYGIDPVDWDNVAVQSPYFQQDAVKTSPDGPAKASGDAKISVKLQPGANLNIDGESYGTVPRTTRDMKSRGLPPGRDFSHKFEATWSSGGVLQTAKAKVIVRADQLTTVNLDSPGDRGTVRPPKSDTPGTVVRMMAGWVDAQVNTRLAYLTSSRAPIVRGDWWIANASVAPNYYRLLRLRTLQDFRNLAGFDERAEDRREIRATIVRSGSHGLATPVARNNRILARTPTFQGPFWQTFDFLDSVKAKNTISNFLNIKETAGGFEVGELSGKKPKEWLKAVRKQKLGFRDAGEWIATLPNGLQFYLLTDAQDKVINEADIRVAFDSTSHDFRVLAARSCIWCHASGIWGFKSQFQQQLGRKQMTDLGIFLKDEEKALELARFLRRTFGNPDFDGFVKSDQELYNLKIKNATGVAMERNAQSFRSYWNSYAEEDLDLSRICYEIGLQPAEVKALFTLRYEGTNDGVLLQQLLRPPIAVRREHWEESFQRVALLSLLLKKK